MGSDLRSPGYIWGHEATDPRFVAMRSTSRQASAGSTQMWVEAAADTGYSGPRLDGAGTEMKQAPRLPPSICMLLLLVVTVLAAAPAAEAAGFSGKTSQGKRVVVQITGHRVVSSLDVQFAARCTDKRTRAFAVDFSGPDVGRQTATGDVSGKVDSFSGNLFGPSYEAHTAFSGPPTYEHATFSAHVTRHLVTGGFHGKATYEVTNGNAVVCDSHRITFRIHT
jgi:hypothetical protein